MKKLVLLALIHLTASPALSWGADPDVLQRQVKVGIYEQLTLADRLAVSAAVLGNPSRFERISFGNAFAVRWDDFSDDTLLKVLRATEKGTAAIASDSGTGEFVVMTAKGAGSPWTEAISSVLNCIQKIENPKKEDVDRCGEYLKEGMVATGGFQVFVTTDSDFKLGKPLGKVVNWNALENVADEPDVTP